HRLLGLGAGCRPSSDLRPILVGLAARWTARRRRHPRQVHDGALCARARFLPPDRSAISQSALAAGVLGAVWGWWCLLPADPRLEHSARLGLVPPRAEARRDRSQRAVDVDGTADLRRRAGGSAARLLVRRLGGGNGGPSPQ